MSENLTHWRKVDDPNYLGAYAFTPGKDMILTIKEAKNEMVTNNEGKKEEKRLLHFEENVKPMIVNVGNGKTIVKLTGSPFLEKWKGHKIQLYVDPNVRAFGEVTEGVRVRPFPPKAEFKFNCSECKGELKATSKMTAEQLAKYTKDTYKTVLCAPCATKRVEQAKQAKQEEQSPEQTKQETEEPSNEQA